MTKVSPSHPGEILREIVVPALEGRGITKKEIAKSLGVSRQTLHALLNEKQRVTPEMAVRLGYVFNTSAKSWVMMQSAYDLARV